jgi:hypothetical protein
MLGFMTNDKSQMTNFPIRPGAETRLCHLESVYLSFRRAVSAAATDPEVRRLRA